MSRLALLFPMLMASCGVVGQASAPLDAYTLQPLPVAQAAASARHLVVELPTASGALTTDRILIKPSALQAQYLPKGRWVDPVPELAQNLLVASLQNSGSFRLVGRDAAGLVPDYVLLVEVNDFEATAPAPGSKEVPVHVGLTLTLLRAGDGRLLATRRLDQTALAASTRPLDVVTAFDAATRLVLADALTWTQRSAH